MPTHEILVELQPQTRVFGQSKHAVFDCRRFRVERGPVGIAVGIGETLQDETVGARRQQVAVQVDEQADFEAWLSAYPSYAEVLSAPAPDISAGQGSYAVCGACHGASGEGNVALNAPKIAGQEAWYIKRQINNFKHGLRGTAADDTFGAQMAPMAATLPDETAVKNVAAYIASLPDADSPSTISGDVSRGEDIFETCKSCHGVGGEGIWALNAPRLKNANDWYMVRQIENYKKGARGAHPQDHGVGTGRAEPGRL